MRAVRQAPIRSRPPARRTRRDTQSDCHDPGVGLGECESPPRAEHLHTGEGHRGSKTHGVDAGAQGQGGMGVPQEADAEFEADARAHDTSPF